MSEVGKNYFFTLIKMNHLIEGCDIAIKEGHNTVSLNGVLEQKWWHWQYTESLYRERENYISGNGRLRLY